MTTYPVPLERRLADMLATLQRRVTLLESRSVTALSAALDPVSGGPETWHPMTLANGWVNNSASDVGASYRLVSTDTVHIIGDIKGGTTSTTTVGISTLPAAYIPAHYCHFSISVFGVAHVAGTEGYVTTSGQMVINATSGATRITFNALIPLSL